MDNRLLLCFICLVIQIGCEQTSEDMSLPFEERLVVYGDLNESIYFERTLPLNTAWTEYSSRLNDVNAYYVSGDRTIEITYSIGARTPGIYFPRIRLADGEHVELFAEWRGKKIRAFVRKPGRPQIDSLTVVIDSTTSPPTLVWKGTYQTVQGEFYASGIFGFRAQDNIGILQNDLKSSHDAGTDGRIHLEGRSPWQGVFPDSVFFNVYAYDKPYYDYLQSRGYYNPPTASLFTASMRSNVRGDGVGVVWAQTTTSKIFRFRNH